MYPDILRPKADIKNAPHCPWHDMLCRGKKAAGKSIACIFMYFRLPFYRVDRKSFYFVFFILAEYRDKANHCVGRSGGPWFEAHVEAGYVVEFY